MSAAANTNGNRRKFTAAAVRVARKDSSNVNSAFAEMRAPATATATAAGAPPDDGVEQDTPDGIRVDYEGPLDTDLPAGAWSDSQVASFVRSVIGRGAAPFFFRFHSQIYVRVCTT